jgi:hypothetical protein
VTVIERIPDRQSSARGEPVPQRTHYKAYASAPAAVESRHPVSVVALIAAVGVLVASAAYAAGRAGYASSAWADRAYWLGQTLVVAPVAQRLLSRRRLTPNETVTLVMVLTVAEYLLKICYSPAGYTFPDELLHWRSTVNILQTGKLFTANYGLPIGPRYPGLEEATSALISVTGLPVFAAGLIIAGTAHLLFICLLYLIYHCFSRSHRIAGIAILIYSSTPTLNSFDSMFVYETLALVFLGLAVLAAWRTATAQLSEERARWFVLAVLAIFATVITHHVTSYMLVGSLLVVTVASRLTKAYNTARVANALTIISAAAVACWVKFIAPATLSYFSGTVNGIVQGISALQSGGSPDAPSTSAAPLGNRVLEGTAVLTITILLPLGWWQVRRHYRHHPWIVAMAIGSLGWFAALALRVGTPDGQELAGRTATFVYIPVSLIAGLALIKLVNVALAHRLGSAAIGVAVTVMLTLLFDGLANGWPPYWERLPGPYQVAGFERSVGPEGIATAQWALSVLGPGNRFAADMGNYSLLAGYGYQNAIQGVGFVYTSAEYTSSVAQAARAQDVQYVLVDQRLSQSLPVSGTYFPGYATASNHPIPIADLTKFDRVRGVSRIYDSGDITIYNLQGAQDAP